MLSIKLRHRNSAESEYVLPSLLMFLSQSINREAILCQQYDSNIFLIERVFHQLRLQANCTHTFTVYAIKICFGCCGCQEDIL